MADKFYAVIDTNVIVSAVISKHLESNPVKIIRAIVQERIIPLYSDEILDEYRDVLSRKKFHLTQTQIDSVLKAVINNGYTGKAELSKIKFSGAEIAPKGTLNALDGKITAEKSSVTLDVTGNAQTITAVGATYECLLVPSDAISTRQDLDLTLTIDDIDKEAHLTGNNGVIIAKGTKSNITIGLSNSGISVSSVSIDEWKEVEVGGHKVTVKRSSEDGIADDVFLDVTSNGSNVTIKSHSALTGRWTSCTCTPAGKATCTPSIDATTGICTFTITDVQDDITAEVSYLPYNATVAYDSNMGAVKLNGAPVTSETPVQILHGEKAEFTAEANTGYGFVKWTDGSDKYLSADNSYTISSVTSNITLNAVFGYEISAEVKPAGAGTVTGAGIYAKGSTATLTATAGGSFAEFTGWAKAESPGTIISKNNPYPSENIPDDGDNKIWPKMEADGVVFLPAAGFRDGDHGLASVSDVGDSGYYWSASPSDGGAYDLAFLHVDVSPSLYDPRDRVHSVRLVTECQRESRAE